MCLLFHYFFLNSTVQFIDTATAESAVRQLNGGEINGRLAHVRLDRSVADSSTSLGGFTVFITNLPWATTNEELLMMFEQYNPLECHILTNMYGKSRGFGKMKFMVKEDALKAIAEMNDLVIKDRKIEVSLLKFTSLLFVWCLNLQRF